MHGKPYPTAASWPLDMRDQTVTEPKAPHTHPYPPIIASLLLLTAASLLAVAPQACGGSVSPDSALGLVPEDVETVTVMDVQRFLRETPTDVDKDGSDMFVDIGVSFNDLTTMVDTWVDLDTLYVLEGRLDFERVRDVLDESDYERRPVRGYEVWENASRLFFESVALIEERDQAVVGGVDAVASALEALDRSRSLRDDADNALTRALKRAGSGRYVHGEEECGIREVRGCRAVGIAIATGSEYPVEITFAFLFRSERTAESAVDAVEDYLYDEFPQEVDIEEVQIDGEFVVATVTSDGDFVFP